MTSKLIELLAELRHHLPLLADAIIEELEKPPVLWPDGVAEHVAELVSPSVWNRDSRTFKTLDKEIVWVVGHWHDRHGPLNEEQRSYMGAVLRQAISQSVRDAGGDKKKLYPFLKTEIRSRLNDDRVAAGFKRRATKLVDIREELSVLQSL